MIKKEHCMGCRHERDKNKIVCRQCPHEKYIAIAKAAAMGQSKPSKYRNKRVKIDGHTFDSIKEGKRYEELKLLVIARQVRYLEVHPRFHLALNGVALCVYEADFKYYENDKEVVEDVKGMKKGSAYQMFLIKKRLMKAALGIDVVEI